MQSGLDARAAAFLIHHAIDAAATQVLVHGIEDPSPERILSGLAEMICGFVLKEEP